MTSPPYWRMRQYGQDPREMGNERTVEAYLDRLLVMFRECLRVCKPTGSVVFNLGDKFIDRSYQLVPYRFAIRAKECANFTNNVIWSKPNPCPLGARRRLVPSHEACFHFTKSSGYYFNPDALAEDQAEPVVSPILGQRYFGMIDESDLSDAEKINAKLALAEVIEDVRLGKCNNFRLKLRGVHALPISGQYGGWKYRIEKFGFCVIRESGTGVLRDVLELQTSKKKGIGHPAPYPVGLPEFFISLLTRTGDVVLDPFVGSGTTAVAAKNFGRHWIGFDLVRQYIDQSSKRVEAA
jgi:site-specific DNA-methyltransferase (adenine-specific)